MPTDNDKSSSGAHSGTRGSGSPGSAWLDRVANRKRTHFGRRPDHQEREREQLLKIWFGPDRSMSEITALRSAPKPIGVVLDGVIRTLGIQEAELVGRIQAAWSDIVGSDISAHSRPIAYRNRVLVVEVTNSTWQFVLERERKVQMTEQLRAFGFKEIESVRITAHGRFADRQ